MKIKLSLIFILTGFLFFGIFLNNSSAKVIETINISRKSPPSPPSILQIPNPPTPPTKPEPSDPPNPPCADCTPTPRPTMTPQPIATPVVTPGTGGTPFCGEGEHLDLSGTKCIRFSDPGVDSPTGGAPVNGQVLGASTMAGTGTIEETLFSLIFILGCLTASFGLKKAY